MRSRNPHAFSKTKRPSKGLFTGGLRIPALLITISLIFALTGCSALSSHGNFIQSPSKDDNTPFNVAIFYYDYSDNYVSAVRSSLTQDLVKAGFPYSEYDAASNQSTQNAQIDAAIDANVSLLIVNIVNSGSSNTTDAICMKAYRAGIPVIFFNRSIEDNGDEGVILNYYDDVVFVGTNPAEAGHLQGQLIGNYLLDHFDKTDLNHDGRISYALFKGEAKNAEAIYRTKYAVEDADAILTKAGYPALYYFNQVAVDYFQLDLTGKWSLTAVQDYMLTNLAQYNERSGNMIELIICNSDTMAEGAIRALQTYGYNLGTTSCTTIPVFGVDASVIGRQLIAEGNMTGTVVQDADAMAACIMKLTQNVEQKKDMLDGTDDYAWDEEHDLHNKLYIPYSLYEPETESEETDESVTEESTAAENAADSSVSTSEDDSKIAAANGLITEATGTAKGTKETVVTEETKTTEESSQ